MALSNDEIRIAAERLDHAEKTRKQIRQISLDHPGVTIVGDDWKPTITALKERPGKDIWLFGGGSLFRTLLDAGFVDGIDAAIIPVLVGGGVPFLETPAQRTRLQLVKHKLYKKSGIVSLQYAVSKQPAKTARAKKKRRGA